MYNFISNNDFIISAKAHKSFEGYRCGLKDFDTIRVHLPTFTAILWVLNIIGKLSI